MRRVQITDICVNSWAIIVLGISPKSHANAREGDVDVIDSEVRLIKGEARLQR
jgi:hypothetical protein